MGVGGGEYVVFFLFSFLFEIWGIGKQQVQVHRTG